MNYNFYKVTISETHMFENKLKNILVQFDSKKFLKSSVMFGFVKFKNKFDLILKTGNS